MVSRVSLLTFFPFSFNISQQKEPVSNDDFNILISPKRISDVDPGHECYPLQDLPQDVGEGSNATLQIKYQSKFDSEAKDTFYACADISFVPVAQFTTQIPCFNVTSSDFTPPASSPSSSGTPEEGSTPNNSTGSGGLSKGGIAGVVVGVVAAVVLAILAFIGYRRFQKQRRLADHEKSTRNVKWEAPGN